MSSPAAVKPYSIAFKIVLFMPNNLHTLIPERSKTAL